MVRFSKVNVEGWEAGFVKNYHCRSSNGLINGSWFENVSPGYDFLPVFINRRGDLFFVNWGRRRFECLVVVERYKGIGLCYH